MGIKNSKIFRNKHQIMLDKANFTSECSLDFTPDSLDTFSQFNSTIEEIENIEFAPISVPMVPNASIESKPKVRLETYSHCNDMPKRRNGEDSAIQKEIEKVYLQHEIEKLGVNKVSCYNSKQYYNGIIYLTECELIMVHYLALYRLKLDTISQYDFENWCFKMGHMKTLKKYSVLVKVYSKMKENHFKDSFIINRIISRKNVNICISDIFGEESNYLRALTVAGDRRSTVQSVLDGYFFAIKGKVSNIIQSANDYKRFANYFFPLKNEKSSLSHPYSSASYQVVKSRLTVNSKKELFTSSSTYSNVFEVLNIHPTSLNDITVNTNNAKNFSYKTTSQVPDSIYNDIRLQKKENDDEDMCYNNPVCSDSEAYNLVSIIADKTYAYILCQNSNPSCNSYDDINLSLLNKDDRSIPENEINQSNSNNRICALKKILRTEIIDCCNTKLYGVTLSKVEDAELYAVRCHLDKISTQRETLLNEILTRHMVYGKLINNLYSQEQGDFVMDLHGKEADIVNCYWELKSEGLGYNFEEIRTYSSGYQKSKQHKGFISYN